MEGGRGGEERGEEDGRRAEGRKREGGAVHPQHTGEEAEWEEGVELAVR